MILSDTNQHVHSCSHYLKLSGKKSI